jgi:hypothetical protein
MEKPSVSNLSQRITERQHALAADARALTDELKPSALVARARADTVQAVQETREELRQTWTSTRQDITNRLRATWSALQKDPQAVLTGRALNDQTVSYSQLKGIGVAAGVLALALIIRLNRR